MIDRIKTLLNARVGNDAAAPGPDALRLAAAALYHGKRAPGGSDRPYCDNCEGTYNHYIGLIYTPFSSHISVLEPDLVSSPDPTLS